MKFNKMLLSSIGLLMMIVSCGNVSISQGSNPSSNNDNQVEEVSNNNPTGSTSSVNQQVNGNWDVSEKGDNSVKANLRNGYLTFSGSGAIKDYNEKETPWYGSSIVEVNFNYGITTLGKNLLKGIDLEGVLLPESITLIKDGATGSIPYIYYDGTSEITVNNIEGRVYYYSEKAPKNGDIYWQEDTAKGDMFDLSHPESLKVNDNYYWNYDENDNPTPYEKNKKRVLFIGNSFTYYSMIPQLFDSVVESFGQSVTTYAVMGGGWYLINHAKPTDTCGKQVNAILEARDDFDYIVLQDQSTCSYAKNADFKQGVSDIQNIVNRTQKNAQIYLYSTWGYTSAANSKGWTIPQMEKEIRSKYAECAKEFNVNMTPVGKAFSDIYVNEPSINLYHTDDKHPSYAGSYLSALTHACNMLDLDVRNCTYNGTLTNESQLKALKLAAYNAIHSDEDPIDTPIDTPTVNEYNLEVAVWGRWISEAKTKELWTAFLEYAKSQSLDSSKYHYTYYVGTTSSDAYYYIANFTDACKETAYIIFPCANNMSEKVTCIENTLIPYQVGTKTDRNVALVKDTADSRAFYDFIFTDAAQKVLNPNYVD